MLLPICRGIRTEAKEWDLRTAAVRPEVRRYGECWALEHGQWDRRMLEVVAVSGEWLPLLDMQRTLRVTHRGKTTVAEMPTAGLGGGVLAADAAERERGARRWPALGAGSGPPCSSFREGSAGYPEPFRDPNKSTLAPAVDQCVWLRTPPCMPCA